MKVAIHQPNFFPWLGFFNKIYQADCFVYLNHTENNPRTAIYTKRVKILVNKQEHWLTLSLKNEPGKVFLPINEMVIDKPARQKDKHLKTWENNYSKAPFFKEVLPILENFYNHPSDFVSERNIATINEICHYLNIATRKVISSDLNIKTASNQMLIDITRSQNGNCYMPGGGAEGYQKDELFAENGIDLNFQNFKHPVYLHFNVPVFSPGLSIVDALMNLGFSGTESIIKNETK